MEKNGRPRAVIDKDAFERLCKIQCTIYEICAYFDITDKTLTRWCKETYGMAFSEIFAIKRQKGLISLRRSQFKMAQNNPTVNIWLAKQYLGQTDTVINQVENLDEITVKVVSNESDKDRVARIEKELTGGNSGNTNG